MIDNEELEALIRRLVRRVVELGRHSQGRLRFSVPFDPFRGEESLSHVRRGLEAGAVAVKFYPPSGYRPARNDIPDKPSFFKTRPPFIHLPATARREQRKQWRSRYRGKDGADLDAAVRRLFELTHQREVPVFSHHTDQGFEAMGREGKKPGYGEMMSPPCYWNEILRQPGMEKLRLVLAHAGGGDGWFGDDPAWEGSFDQQAYNLCVQFPNVYCEFGYSSEVLTATGRAAFRRRLERLIGRPISPTAERLSSACSTKQDAAARYDIRDKLVYGSDWHVMSRVPHQNEQVCRFAEVLSSPLLETSLARFFGENARRAFGLDP